jgi:hypothetical protein
MMRVRFDLLPLLLASLVATATSGMALEHRWSRSFGDAWAQVPVRLAALPLGHVAVVGSFAGTVDFGGGPLISAGEYDVFLAVFDAGGQHCWSRRFGDAANDKARDIDVDAAGNIVITGDFFGGIDFGGAPLSSAGDKDAFLASFDASGNHRWSRSFGDAAYDSGWTLSCGPGGAVSLAGRFRGAIDLGGGPLTAFDGVDLFLARFGADGQHLWSQAFGHAGDQVAQRLRSDGAGDLLLAGTYEGLVDFGGGALVSEGGLDAFAVKFAADGSHVWSRSFGGPGDDELADLAVDGAGGFAVTGAFEESIDLGTGPLQSAGETDILLARYTGNGHHLWSAAFGSGAADRGRAVALDAGNEVVLASGTWGSLDFGGGLLIGAGGGDLCLARFDAAGAHRWSDLFGDAQWEGDPDLEASSTGALHLSAFYFGTIDFGGGPLISAGNADIALAQFAPIVTAAPAPEGNVALNAFPNPFNPRVTLSFELPVESAATLAIFDAAGRRVATLASGRLPAGGHRSVWEGRDDDGAALPSGVYFVQLRTRARTAASPLVLLR